LCIRSWLHTVAKQTWNLNPFDRLLRLVWCKSRPVYVYNSGITGRHWHGSPYFTCVYVHAGTVFKLAIKFCFLIYAKRFFSLSRVCEESFRKDFAIKIQFRCLTERWLERGSANKPFHCFEKLLSTFPLLRKTTFNRGKFFFVCPSFIWLGRVINLYIPTKESATQKVRKSDRSAKKSFPGLALLWKFSADSEIVLGKKLSGALALVD
jgi:hypothetical protein